MFKRIMITCVLSFLFCIMLVSSYVYYFNNYDDIEIMNDALERATHEVKNNSFIPKMDSSVCISVKEYSGYKEFIAFNGNKTLKRFLDKNNNIIKEEKDIMMKMPFIITKCGLYLLAYYSILRHAKT